MNRDDSARDNAAATFDGRQPNRARPGHRDVEWLADVHRNHDFVVHPPPDSLVALPWATEHGLSQGMCHHQLLSYEPRSIAVSMRGTAAAIGTKSGAVHVARWDEAGKSWQSLAAPIPLADDQGQARPSPVRALCFLSEDLLVAGWGSGELTILEVSTGRSIAVERHTHVDENPPPHGWFDRFTDILSLVPNKAPAKDLPQGMVALGLTSGYRVHVLIKDGPRFRSITTTPSGLGIPAKVGQQNARNDRLIGGVWAHQRLWLMNSHGIITCLERRSEERRKAASELDPLFGFSFPLGIDASSMTGGSYQVVPIREPADFKEIRGCKLGLAVRVSDDITVLRFARDPEATTPRLVPSQRWESAPDALDFTVGMPFFNDQANADALVETRTRGGTDYHQPIRKKDPLWVVVATEKPGLRWMAWKDNTTTGKLEPVGGAAPHRAGFPAVTLYLQLGWRKEGAAFLVCADRSHQFRIVPLLESRSSKRFLQEFIPRSGEGAQDPGIGWWLLCEAIRSNIGSDTPLPSYVPAALQHRDAADLRSLLRTALGAWRQVTKLEAERERKQQVSQRALAGAEAALLAALHAKKLANLREWLWRLLERAHELDEPQLAASLGRQAFDALASSLIPDEAGDNQPEAWADVGLLAGFLRKWVVFGHTYAKTDCALSELYHLNQDCGEHLDALTYVTLLLKQKTDFVWKRRLGDSATHWALASADDGSFSLHSDSEGYIHALARDGRSLPWLVDKGRKWRLNEYGLDVANWAEGGLPYLQHAHAVQYRATMRRGPQARRVLLFRALGQRESEGLRQYVAVFHFRGLRGDEEPRAQPQNSSVAPVARGPRLYAVLLALEPDGSGLRVCDVRSCLIPGDLYGLAKLAPSPQQPGLFQILAGTNGSWESGEAVAPFIELDLKLGAGSIDVFARAEVTAPHLVGEIGGMPRVAYRPAHNPCWCLVPDQEGSATWLWTGFKDGHIRPYRRDVEAGRVVWRYGGGWQHAERNAPLRPRPERPGFQTSAAVWSLHLLRAGPGTNGARLLAYGTADGVIGVMELPKIGSEAPPVHVVHTEVTSPICGLADYEEDGTRKLAAVAQNGGVSLFDVGEVARAGIHAKSTFSGARLDRFGFAGSARAVAIVQAGEEVDAPTFLVGTSDGQVHKRRLVACRGSQARRNLAVLALDLFARNAQEPSPPAQRRSVADMSACVGSAFHEWLRVLDVGGDHLQRFSIWHELHNAAALVNLQGDTPASGVGAEHRPEPEAPQFEAFLRTLKELSEHAFRRRPFSREAVKIVWDEGARVANLACRRALGEPDVRRRRQLLDFNSSVTRLLEKIANRWISHAPEMESRILMQVFNAVFDWSDVVLLARLDAEAAEETRSNRRFVVESLAARGLDYADPLVSLEVLRTINDALLLALVHLGKRDWTCSLYPEATDPGALEANVGWFDVVQLVGSMMSRSHVVLLSSLPLFTQAARFFALSLLLTPDSSLLVLQVISENSLHALDVAISEHLRASFEQLHREFGVPTRHEWRRLAVEVRRHFNPQLAGSMSAHAPPEARGTLTNEDYQREAAAVNQTLMDLKDVHDSATPSWLARDLAGIHYFKHSHRFMTWVEGQRAGLRGRSAAGKLDECRELLRLLPELELFEPQRSRYRVIFEAWLKQVGEDAQFAIDNLDLVEGFNRHVYRASADDLLTVASELALQTSPMFPGSGPVPGLHEQLKRHPLIHELVDRGTRLAESSQLIEIIITIAARRARQHRGNAGLGTVSLPELFGLVKSIAAQQQLDAWPGSESVAPSTLSHVQVPGNRAIWGAILQEWFKNVWRYGSRPRRDDSRPLWYRLDNVDGGWRIRMAGGRAFTDGLQLPMSDDKTVALRLASLIKDLEQPGVAADERGKLLERLQETLEQDVIAPLGHQRGHRYHAGAGPAGSGYGLNLVFKLCDFINVQHGLVLASPIQVGPQDPRELPLCLELGVKLAGAAP
jgi:hypothetical protein